MPNTESEGDFFLYPFHLCCQHHPSTILKHSFHGTCYEAILVYQIKAKKHQNLSALKNGFICFGKPVSLGVNTLKPF